MCSPASTTWETKLFNEAAQGIKGWPRRDAKPAAASDADAPLRVLERTAPPQPPPEGLAALLVGSGPWEWGRLAQSTSGLFLLARGVAFVGSKEPKPGTSGALGRWRAVGADKVELRMCDRTFTLSFGSPDAPWAFSAVNADGAALASGRLSDTMQHVPLGLAGVDAAALRMAPLQESSEAAPHTMAEQLFGTGPWQWAGHSGLSFLRGGRLVTPWGTGTWGVQRRGGDEKVPATDSIFADFGGGEHTLTRTLALTLTLTNPTRTLTLTPTLTLTRRAHAHRAQLAVPLLPLRAQGRRREGAARLRGRPRARRGQLPLQGGIRSSLAPGVVRRASRVGDSLALGSWCANCTAGAGRGGA